MTTIINVLFRTFLCNLSRINTHLTDTEEDFMKKNREPQLPERGRNIRRTKTALRNTLIELMKTKSILCITVKEICYTADVGRSTFYAHYESQYSLLEEIVQESMLVFEKELGIDKPLRKETNQGVAQKTEKILEFIANNNAVQILLSENGDSIIQRKFINRLDSYLKYSKRLYTDNLVKEKISECYSIFYVRGLIALLQHWLKNNMQIPIPELTKVILSFDRVIRE
jgi:AcrR family transcriptional regulator